METVPIVFCGTSKDGLVYYSEGLVPPTELPVGKKYVLCTTFRGDNLEQMSKVYIDDVLNVLGAEIPTVGLTSSNMSKSTSLRVLMEDAKLFERLRGLRAEENLLIYDVPASMCPQITREVNAFMNNYNRPSRFLALETALLRLPHHTIDLTKYGLLQTEAESIAKTQSRKLWNNYVLPEYEKPFDTDNVDVEKFIDLAAAITGLFTCQDYVRIIDVSVSDLAKYFELL